MALENVDEKVLVQYTLDSTDFVDGQKKMQNETNKTEKNTKDKNKSMSESFKTMSIKSKLAIAAIITSLTLIIGKMKSAADEAARYERAMRGLSTVAEAFGQNGGAAQKLAKEIEVMTKGMVSAEKAAQGLKFIIGSGFSLDQASEMSQALLNTGAYNRVVDDLGDAFVDASKGIKTGSIELIENIGLTEKLSSVMKRANIDISNGIDITNNAAQRQAFYNSVMQQGILFAGNLDKAVQGYDASMARLNLTVDKVTRKIGTKLQPVISKLANTISDLLEPLVNDVPPATESLANLVSQIQSLQSVTNPTSEDTQALQEAMNKIAEISPTLVSGYDDQGNAIVKLNEAQRGLLELKSLELEAQKEKLRADKELGSEELKQQRWKIQNEERLLEETIQNLKITADQRRDKRATLWEDIAIAKEESAAVVREANKKITAIHAEQQAREDAIISITKLQNKLTGKNVAETIIGSTEQSEKQVKTAKETQMALSQINQVTNADTLKFYEEKSRIETEAEQLRQERLDEIKKSDEEYFEWIRNNREEERAYLDEQAEADRQRAEEAAERQTQAAKDEIERLKQIQEVRDFIAAKKKKEMEQDQWNLAIEKANTAARVGYNNAISQSTKDLLSGELKGAKDYAKIIAENLKTTLTSISIDSTVRALWQTAQGIGSAALGLKRKAATHFLSARKFAITASAAGLGAVAANSISGGGGNDGIETATGIEEEETQDTLQEEINQQEIVYISEEDKNRLGFALVDTLNEALDNGKAIKVAR